MLDHLTKLKNISSRRADFLSYAFLLLLPLVFFWRETLGLFTLGAADVLFWFYPIWKLAAEQVKSGHLPLWNPYNYGGTPLFAQWQPGLLDPLNWIHLLGPSSRTLTLAQQASFSIALLGMFLFTRRLGMARRACLVSAVIYALSGYAVARAIYPGALHIYVLVPLVLFYVERLFQEGRRRDVVYGALIVAWQIFAGHAQIILYSSLLASAYALFCAFLRSEQSTEEAGSGPAPVRNGGVARIRFLAQFALMFVLGIALSAVQLIPAWEVATQSERQRIPYEIFTMNSLHPLSLLTAVFPFFHGGGNAFYRLPYWGPYWSHNEGQIYLGVLALSLAVSAALCFWRERSHLILFWSIIPIAACLLAFGKYLSPISRAVYRTPLLNLFRGSDRHWMEVVFAVSILAGYAVDRILRGDGRSVARLAQYVITALVIFNAAVGLFILRQRDRAEAIIRGLHDMGFLSPGFLREAGAEFYLPVIMAACLLISLLFFARSRSQGRWYFLLLFILIVDFHLYAHFAPINRPGRLESGEFASPIGKAVPPEIVAQQNESEPMRYHLLLNQGPIAFNPYWFYGHEMATGYDPVINTRYSAFTGIDEVGRSTRPTLLDTRDRTLDLLNARYLLVPRRILNSPVNSSLKDDARWREVAVQKYDPSDYDSLVYENLKALPRAWLVERVEGRPDQEQLKLIRGEATEPGGFDPLETALIDPADAAKLDRSLLNIQGDGTEALNASLKIVRRESSSMTIEAELSRPSLLVMSEVSFPGWRARVDGREAELLRVDYLLRGIGLGAGKHRVEIFYWPRLLTVGAVISGLTVSLLIIMVISERGISILREIRSPVDI